MKLIELMKALNTTKLEGVTNKKIWDITYFNGEENEQHINPDNPEILNSKVLCVLNMVDVGTKTNERVSIEVMVIKE